MSGWELVMTVPATKDMANVPKGERAAVWAGMEQLSVNPYSGNVKKLATLENEWRLRVGRWRVRFLVHKAARIIEVLHVLPRGSAYRDL